MRATRSTRTPEQGPHRPLDDQGAALVEFALVLPLLLMMMLGIFSGGIAYNQKLQVTHAVREGARYGATIPAGQDWASGTWASNVRELVVERSADDLAGSQICVALVENTSVNSVTVVTVDATTPKSDFTTNGSDPCYDEPYPQYNANDVGRRVQVSASRDASIELGIFPSIDVTISSEATGRAEYAE